MTKQEPPECLAAYEQLELWKPVDDSDWSKIVFLFFMYWQNIPGLPHPTCKTSRRLFWANFSANFVTAALKITRDQGKQRQNVVFIECYQLRWRIAHVWRQGATIAICQIPRGSGFSSRKYFMHLVTYHEEDILLFFLQEQSRKIYWLQMCAYCLVAPHV